MVSGVFRQETRVKLAETLQQHFQFVQCRKNRHPKHTKQPMTRPTTAMKQWKANDRRAEMYACDSNFITVG